MDFFDHLAELRNRLIRSFVGILLVFGVCFFFSDYLLSFLSYPFEKAFIKVAQTAQLRAESDDIEDQTVTDLPNPAEKLDLSQYECSCREHNPRLFSAALDNQNLLSNSLTSNQSLNSTSVDTLMDNNLQLPPSTDESSTNEKQLSCICKLVAAGQADDQNQISGVETDKKAALNQTVNNTHQDKKSAKKANSSQPFFVLLDLTEVLLVKIKIAFWSSLFFLFPYLIGELWGFVAPAMYKKEKKVLITIILGSYFCFIGGAVFTYIVVFPAGFEFFLGLANQSVAVPTISLIKYLDFALLMLFVFGIFFEMPMLCLVLAEFGIITASMMLQHARLVIVGIFFLAAIFTPPDPISMLLLALPMVFLYFITYLLIGFRKGFR